MNRRHFLKQSTVSALGLYLTGRASYGGDLNINTSFDGRVLIVGAGPAGLFAGCVLKANGIDYSILEASGRVGGRIKRNTTFADFAIDLGAEWMHGDRSVLGDLTRRNGLQTFEDTSEERFWYQNQLRTSLPGDVRTIVDQSVFERTDGGNRSLLDYAINRMGVDPDAANLIESAAGARGAPARDIGVEATRLDEYQWSSGLTDFKFRDGLATAITDTLVSEVQDQVVLNAAVEKIEYSGDTVRVQCTNGITHSGHHVILTVPITMLKKRRITFTPALPDTKLAAIDRIGMGPGMKVFLKFRTKFFDENLSGGDLSPFYYEASYGKNTSELVYVAFVMGDKAAHLSSLGDGAIPALLDELDGIYDGAAGANYIDGFVQDWSKEPFIEGAYSYAAVSMRSTDRETVSIPVANKLFFAGEATHTSGHSQTVHGAMETGQREVERVLDNGAPRVRPPDFTEPRITAPSGPPMPLPDSPLFEHTVRLETGSSALTGFELEVSGVPARVVIANASGHSLGGITSDDHRTIDGQTIRFSERLPVWASASVRLQYLATDGGSLPSFTPQFSVREIDDPPTSREISLEIRAISHRQAVLRSPVKSGARYLLQGSTDLDRWTDVFAFDAAGHWWEWVTEVGPGRRQFYRLLTL
ncbi:MAG: NAD(P)/FAD-dependent oxidoreductase [Verrucomicrobiota bacterium]